MPNLNIVPKIWLEERLDNLAKVVDSAHQTPIFSNAGFPMVRVGDIKGGKISLANTVTVNDEVFSIFTKNYKPQFDDILMTRVGSYGRSSIVKTHKTFCLGQNTVVINPQIIVADYLYQYLQAENIQAQIDDTVSGSSQKSLSLSAIKALRISSPHPPEQQKIAAILTSVDEVIEKTQAQIDKLKDLKSGMMQELLTKGVGIKQGDKYAPHTEFKDSPVGRIPKGWAVTKLSKLINVMESGWSPQCESTPAPNGEWCILKTTAVSWNGFNPSANKKLPNELEPRPQIQVKANDILITRAGPAERVGVISHVDFVPEKVMLSDKIIRIQTNRCISKFLSLWLSSSFVQKYLASRVSGLAMSQTNISQSILQNIFCVIPPLEEQQAITNTINSLEVRFIATEKKLNSLILMKKALMQDLLTGKVRVKVDNDLVS
ncbi:restriction endonuclease subunit S [Shewanella baltica]|uniref:restriction endonuclease subunit S n=1 Tax=Shewanella baltica TaxID=62322 RepID=UPI000E05BB42|nr:restriction endonuclease subunit S [Shewanella baltica]SUI41842.1 Type I restriction enzyme EcoKI specificity protein [Shewanella baltica]